MCATCGCDDEAGPRITVPHEHDLPHGHGHGHGDGHEHGHGHGHDGAPVQTETVTLEQQVLAKNDLLAERTRGWLAGRGVTAINVMSSPGAGKTTLLERTIRELSGSAPIAVIEGDQETLLDAERIRSAGCVAVQVNTGAGCHLDAQMMHDALIALDPAPGTLVFVENVGNLVCPALFDLGEQAKVVIISTPEGTDKPLKYPHIFAVADLVVVNKVDLLPYVDFELETCGLHAGSVNPGVEVLAVSASTGEGMEAWYRWIADRRSGRS
ncbi:hydrogenase accessory protein hypb [Rhodococcus ruber BKS 20-38]|uniref:Hydrogenase accessory protein hypb n=1 Tax=Rhodococcus ruber BKS 20-38 TaxID=1278076 RepID=M2ZFZ7_9NOCA|nr:hydrogenase nickel incorporation protein HypB [Rhodococcus ruber]EME66237.1 hydrogenase accessory protein hypb [Rhodococcus ruber BKS 20-38]